MSLSLFNLRLKMLRERSGENQETVANSIGVSRSSYAGYETSNIIPSYTTIKKLADRFHVSVDYLMGQSNFENYKIDTENVPNIINQLKLILDELSNESVRVMADGYELSIEDKKLVIPYVDGVLNAIKLIKERK